jgi:hypothetical protein
MTIIDCRRSDDITVQFEDGTIVPNKAYNSFKRGEIANPNYNNRDMSNEYRRYGVPENKLNAIHAYHYKHKELSVEQAVMQWKEIQQLKLNTPVSARDICIQNQVPEDKIHTAIGYINKHKEISPEQAFLNWKKLQSLKDHDNERFNKYGIIGDDVKSVRSYANRHKELTLEQAIIEWKRSVSKESFKDICIRYGASEDDVRNIRRFKKGHSNQFSSDEELIKEYLKLKENKYLFKKKCIESCIDPNKARQYQLEHPELTDEEIIEYILNRKKSDHSNLRKLCIKNDINAVSAINYQRKNNCSDEETVKHLLKYKGTENFTNKCIRFNIQPEVARTYKSRHTEMSDEQIILHYRPDLIINIFGELVEYKE